MELKNMQIGKKNLKRSSANSCRLKKHKATQKVKVKFSKSLTAILRAIVCLVSRMRALDLSKERPEQSEAPPSAEVKKNKSHHSGR